MTFMGQILDKGVNVVRLQNGQRITAESFRQNPGVFLPAILRAHLGNDESLKKAKRLREVWAEKKRKAARGEHTKLPLPCWLKRTPTGENGSTPKVVVDEAKAATVRQIFSWAAAGLRWVEIAGKLQGVPPITREGGPWRVSTLRRLLRDRTGHIHAPERRAGSPGLLSADP